MKRTILMLASAVMLFSACKKSKTEEPKPPASPAIGYWTGSYTTIGKIGSTNYAMLIQEGGAARVYDMDNKTDTSQLSAAQKATAVWTLTGNILQTTYKTGSKTVNTTATVNAAFNNMTGTWAFEGTTKGNITLNK